MVNYQQSKIYCIRSNKTTDIYIGSTAVLYLSSRIAEHNAGYKKYLKTKKKYISSYEILKHGDAFIELICHFKCNSSDEWVV